MKLYANEFAHCSVQKTVAVPLESPYHILLIFYSIKLRTSKLFHRFLSDTNYFLIIWNRLINFIFKENHRKVIKTIKKIYTVSSQFSILSSEYEIREQYLFIILNVLIINFITNRTMWRFYKWTCFWEGFSAVKKKTKFKLMYVTT